ncbi:-dimethyl-8-ribityllumazine synthase [Plasmopara halstedii]|uniref:6,7-dimethyl-8-ribityllumazine synthase n=1 Tax=Plasmopara halstedii TaxID=4781 RepID=A0A0P1A6L0_PLAHL|nr:-dimethyl-8-ribityllumazine synthase [Plasmopara halstedii]CEG36050.1 -dimethyl-8-ribityllumazine synthase [Plasmopara halstedii]|eukprot:XP_024572419.1 -dimethyl-8-ribityllumazine synthase [Plasmopara halstedii]
MTGIIKQHALKALSSRKIDGTGLRVAIVHTKWNATIVDSLVAAAKSELLRAGVTESDIVIVDVPGAYELPYAASRLIASQKLDAVICVGTLIKGDTMHFEYICEAVSQGIMRVQLESGVPVLFGVLTVLNEQQAKDRAGFSDNGHNHGTEWAQSAIEMGHLRKATSNIGCPMLPYERPPYNILSSNLFCTGCHIVTIGVLSIIAMTIAKKLT